MQNHGNTLKIISKEEYDHAQVIVTRGFSGHWMLFSSAAMMILTGVAEVRRRRILSEPLELYNNGVPDIEKEPETVSSGKSVIARSMRGELNLDEETKKCDATQATKVYDPNTYAEPFVTRAQAFWAIAAYILSILANLPMLTPLCIHFSVISDLFLFDDSSNAQGEKTNNSIQPAVAYPSSRTFFGLAS